MRTTQGARAARGSDAGIVSVFAPRGAGKALTLILERRKYLLRWTAKGPAALWRPLRRRRRRALRALEKVRARHSYAEYKEARGDPLNPMTFEPGATPQKTDPNNLRQVFLRPFRDSVSGTEWMEMRSYIRTPLPQIIAQARWLALQEEEVQEYRGTSLSAEISRAAQDLGLSRSTLDRVLHGKLRRLSWETVRRLRRALTAGEWEELRICLWSPRRRVEYEGYL